VAAIVNGASQVQVLDGNPLQPFQQFVPFASSSVTSISVSSEDVNLDGFSDIIVCSGSRLKIFSGTNDALLASFVVGTAS
jgi:hypothetical protein